MHKALALGVLAAIATAACGPAKGETGGPVTARNFSVGGFDRIAVAGPYDVDVRTGSGPTVSARGPQKMLERLVIEVKDGELQIHPRNEHGFNFSFHDHGKVMVSVTVPALRAAAIAGSGGIRVDRVAGEQFAGDIAGSGDIALGQVEVGRLAFSVAGSGGASARAGRARDIKFDIAGSGDVDTRGVQAETANISIAGSGGVNAHAARTASVSIMGSGDVEIKGGAKCSVSKAGSGDVRCS